MCQLAGLQCFLIGSKLNTTQPVVLVTGSANGIGLAAAQKFLSEGYFVALTDLDAGEITKVAQTLDANQIKAAGFEMDVADTNSVNAAIEAVVKKFGRLDVLVNNAGNFRQISSADCSDEDWDFIVNVHLSGTFRCSRAAYPYLKNSNQAAIVSISSIAAQIGLPKRLSYSAAKAGVEGLTRVLAVEWAKDGIRVNAVAPGFTESRHLPELEKKGLSTAQSMIDATPLGRFAKTSEQADAIFFLGSANSAFITGQTITVDGGATLDIRI